MAYAVFTPPKSHPARTRNTLESVKECQGFVQISNVNLACSRSHTIDLFFIHTTFDLFDVRFCVNTYR